jgi:hypothetical protein
MKFRLFAITAGQSRWPNILAEEKVMGNRDKRGREKKKPKKKGIKADGQAGRAREDKRVNRGTGEGPSRRVDFPMSTE